MPGRVVLLLALMILNGLTEGLSMALLYPLLTTAGIGDAAAGSVMMAAFEKGFALLGLAMTLGSIVAVIAMVVFVQSAIFLAQNWLGARLMADCVCDWRTTVMAAIFRAKWQFFVGQRQGNLLHTLISDTQQIGVAFGVLTQLATAGVVSAVFIAYSVVVSWQATVALLLAASMIIAAGTPILRRGGRVGAAMAHYGAEMHTMASEFIGGAKLIKATATEEDASTAFGRGMTRWYDAYFWSRFQPSLLRVTFEGLGIILLCVFFWIGRGALGLDVGALLVVLALFVRLYPKLSNIQQNIHVLSVALPAVGRVMRLMRAAEDSAEPVATQPLPSGIRGAPIDLRVVDVDAGYGQTTVLHGVSLEAMAGETIAIVGPSGAGKSTLVDCLLHLVDISRGEIRVNGVSLAELPIASWRASIGYVAQDTFLFNASILENILWGGQRFAAAEAEAAARLAGAHEFITRLPEGYRTLVGDRGVRLSGGQRQRIGLARALVMQRHLLILDEATSALDTQTEQEVMKTIYDLRGRITTIIIAHRLSTVSHADRIYVLDRGRVVESGTWHELLARKGRLAEMWNLQQTVGTMSHDVKRLPATEANLGG